MNTKSIRFRLTVWYSTALFTATIFIFIIFYLVTRQILHSQADQMLVAHADKIAEVVTQQTQEVHEEIAKRVFVQEFSQIPGELAILLDSNGEVVVSSFSDGIEMAPFLQMFTQAKGTQKPFLTDQSIGAFTMRFYGKPIIVDNTFAGVVFIGTPLNVIRQSLSSLFSVLVLVLFVFAFLTVIGGYFLAGRTLRPVAAIAEKLKDISSEDLDQRIENPNTGDELEDLAVTFNSLLDRLNAAFRRERQFIGDLAHELKTPLANLRSGVEIALSKERTKTEYKKTLTETLIDINRLTSTLKNILDLAWSEADNARIQAETFSFSEVIEDLKDTAAKMSFKKRIAVEGTIEPDVIVSGKKDKLSRAILNIIDNAIKYSQEGDTIRVSLAKTHGYAVTKVKDTGIGISKKDLPHIFDRFYRGSDADKITGGSGLGLAIAQAVITAHRGQVSAKSHLGKGTIIIIKLPLA